MGPTRNTGTDDEFYVGYVAKAPVSLGRKIRWISAGLILAGLAVGVVLTRDQGPFANSMFEYGVQREYSGVVEEWPYPILRTRDASFLLVAEGKHGLSDAVRGFQGKSVHLQGTLIEREQDQMLEVQAGSLSQAPGSPVSPAEPSADLGPVRLRGEIVDSKCYLGVMNPGNGKVHRDCAVRCISGGAPPAFVARDASGETRTLLLVGSNGRALNREVLDFVAEPIEITGDLVRSGSHLVLKAEPSRFRRDAE